MWLEIDKEKKSEFKMSGCCNFESGTAKVRPKPDDDVSMNDDEKWRKNAIILYCGFIRFQIIFNWNSNHFCIEVF